MENSLIFAKDAWIIRLNFILIAAAFSEKKNGDITFVSRGKAEALLQPAMY
jgi:hypothetical protein